MDFQDFLAEKRALVEDKLRDICSSFSPSSGKLKEAMEYSLLSGGKRIRPGLAMAACEAMDGALSEVLPFAAAIEMIHTYSLIHDDLPCLDNDDVRRGQPTCHRIFGEAVALLAGDGLLTEAFRVMAAARSSDVPASVCLQIMEEVGCAAGASGMVAGQALDVLSERKKGSKRIVNYIHRNKTGALIRASVLVGALVGRAGSTQLRAFRVFGESVGIAFQIKDDLLDVEGTEADAGKRLRKDCEKQTYVKHYGVAASRRRMTQLVDKAVSSVAFLGPKGDMLIQIARYVGERSS